MIKAIKIDVEKRAISEVQIDEKNFLKECYREIECNLIECACNFETDTIYVDEEGLCKKPKGFFHVSDIATFAGNGLVVGYNAAKDKHIDTTFTVQDIIDLVRFVNEPNIDDL